MATAYTDQGRQLAALIVEMTGGPRPFAVEGLAQYFLNTISRGTTSTPEELIRASTNTATRYTLPPGLALTAAALEAGVRRLPADPALRGPDAPYAELQPFTGRIDAPLLTIHGTGDLQIPVSQERALRRTMEATGTDHLLVQRLMRIPGHCQFSVPEQARAFDDLVVWVREGIRPQGDDVFGDLRNAGMRFTEPLRPGDPGGVNAP